MVIDTIDNRKLQLFGRVCIVADDWLLKMLMLQIVEVDEHRGGVMAS